MWRRPQRTNGGAAFRCAVLCCAFFFFLSCTYIGVLSAPPSDVRTCRSMFVTNLLLPIITTFFLVVQEARPLEPEPVVHPSRPRASRVRCNQGTFVKFQPQSVDFLEISNPRAVLETTMRHFSCLTEGDVICLPYNDRVQQPFFRATRVCRVLCFFW